MATSTQIHLADYLHTSYRPDREYIDGELVERNVGKFEHSRTQALITGWFAERKRATGLMVLTAQRVQVSPTRVRIPDVALVPVGSHPDILLAPPVLIIEILSPGDSFDETQRRAEDYTRMGVEQLWIVDSTTRSGRMYANSSWSEATQLTAANGHISLDLMAIFDSIERAS